MPVTGICFGDIDMSNNSNLSSEDIGVQELEKTKIASPVKWFLVLCFLLTICAIPLVQYCWEPGAEDSTGSLLPKTFSVFSFADQSRELEEIRQQGGGLMNTLNLTRFINAKIMEKTTRFESTIEEESWLLKVAAPSVETLLIGALGAGSQNVYCGRDGWLFFRPTIEYLTGRGFLDPAVLQQKAQSSAKQQEPVQPDPIKAIIDFRDQLAQRGIELVVLPAPAKATIYPERFSGRYDDSIAPLQNPSYKEFLHRLETQKVRVFDPAPLLMQAKAQQEVFLKTDTHWSPAGAELVARGLQDYLEKNRLLPPRTPSNYVRVADKVENSGDLAKMLKIPESDSNGKQQVTLHPVTLSDGTPWASSRDADLLFLGDSYANIFSLDGMGWGNGAGLVEQLSFGLQRPVDSILINDKGSFTTRQQLGNELRRGEDRLAGKKVVIYEFATRELAIGNWKLIDLPLVKTAAQPEKITTGETAKAVIDQQQMIGIIEEISQPPRPNTTAYKDAVIAMHLKEVTIGGQPFKASEVVVFTWGMRDNAITSSSRYKRGQQVALKVRPWSEVERKYGSYQRIELANDDTILLDIFWLIQPDEAGKEEVVLPVTTEKQRKDVDNSLHDQKVEMPAEVTKPMAIVALTPPSTQVDSVQKQVEAPLLPADCKEMKTKFQERLDAIGKELEEKQSRVYSGRDGWLFSRQEISHISKGPFWGEASLTASIAANPDSRDPLAAILDFKQQLDRAGIELIVVPVPAKAYIYPDKLVDGIRPENIGPNCRFDQVHQEFLSLLNQAGVEYLDLAQVYLEARQKDGPLLFLRTDTHWSPEGLSLVAQAIEKKVAMRPWFKGLPKSSFARTTEGVGLKGDMMDGKTDAGLPEEKITISRIRQVKDDQKIPVEPDRKSPILLIGDSHTLIFHSGGDMYAEGAGLPENLAYELGVNVDLVGVRGSGATPARVELVRRRDNMEGKKLVVWCFTVREYTESSTGWKKLPVIR